MEKIKNYKLKDFLRLQNEELILSYVGILELLRPVKVINNPKHRFWNREPRKYVLKPVKSLTFGEVAQLRSALKQATVEAIFEAVSMVTGLSEKELRHLHIIDFYSVIATIKEELTEIANMEINELQSDDFDINLEAVRANERMSRFGVLNPINSLAGEDITKWEAIEKLPYLTVFTKLVMDKEKAAIQKELNDLIKKNKKN